MQGFPKQTLGSTEIRLSNGFTLTLLSYAHYTPGNSFNARVNIGPSKRVKVIPQTAKITHLNQPLTLSLGWHQLCASFKSAMLTER
jgi:hypothetical protein